MVTIREAVSRIRHRVKAVQQDAFLTDRLLYSLIQKHAALLLRRQDERNRLMRFNSLFQTLDFVALEEVDRVQAGCRGVASGCTFRRTRQKLPQMLEGYWGPLIRAVTSLDISQELVATQPTLYERMQSQGNFKYNKKKYYWYLEGHLYFPDLDWDAVRVEGIFVEDTSRYNCAEQAPACAYTQDRTLFLPAHLYSEIEQLVDRDLGLQLQVPVDQQHDLRHVAR
jgi:hypothetical protein